MESENKREIVFTVSEQQAIFDVITFNKLMFLFPSYLDENLLDHTQMECVKSLPGKLPVREYH